MASKELEMVIEALRALGEDLSVEEWLAKMLAGFTQFQLAQDVRCEPMDAGDVPAEWISTPESVDERVIYYLHGGGYVFGSISTHREMASRLSRAAAARVLLIDYRLAPENPFPAAVEDAIAVYRWLLSIGVDTSKLIIAGESAGGGLTVATMVALRDAGEPLPAASICLSPWVDLECLGESMNTKTDVDKREGILMLAKRYLEDTDPRTPLAAPIYADLTGLPPLLIQVGTAEVLFDDATRLAERAKLAGVDVVLESWEDMIHMWHFFAAMLPEGQQAIGRIGDFIKKHTS